METRSRVIGSTTSSTSQIPRSTEFTSSVVPSQELPLSQLKLGTTMTCSVMTLSVRQSLTSTIDSSVPTGRPWKRSLSNTGRYTTRALASRKVSFSAGWRSSLNPRARKTRRSRRFGTSPLSLNVTIRSVSRSWILRTFHVWTLKAHLMCSSKHTSTMMKN